jgi:hypothetical protein
MIDPEDSFMVNEGEREPMAPDLKETLDGIWVVSFDDAHGVRKHHHHGDLIDAVNDFRARMWEAILGSNAPEEVERLTAELAAIQSESLPPEWRELTSPNEGERSWRNPTDGKTVTITQGDNVVASPYTPAAVLRSLLRVPQPAADVRARLLDAADNAIGFSTLQRQWLRDLAGQKREDG